jgi:hypothetical protein
MSRLLVSVIAAVLVFGALAAPVGAQERSRTRVPWGYVALENVLGAGDLGLVAPGALAWDAGSEALVVQDDATGRALRVQPLGRRLGTTNRAVNADLAARHPVTRNLFVLDARSGILRELDWFGRVISQRDLRQFRLRDVTSITLAPSADQTDAADTTNLFLTASSGVDDGDRTQAGVYELSLTAPELAPSLAAVTASVGTPVQAIPTSLWDPASPDPSGIGYSSLTDELIVADGEVDEVTGATYERINVWASTRGGVARGAIDGEAASPRNKEAVGVAFDPVNNELYVCKDGSSSRVWVYTANTDGTFTQVRTFLVNDFAGDAEGLAFGDGMLFIADGSNRHVWKIDPGVNGIVDGVDDVVDGFDTLSLGIRDPEGIGFHPGTHNLWIASRREDEGIFEVTQAGEPVSQVSYGFPVENPGGLDIAPSSADINELSIWLVARGVDNGDDPEENDGFLYEIPIGAGGPPPPPPGGNVLSNGDFELATGGLPDDWTPTDPRFTQSSAVVHGGSFAGLHSATDNSGYKVMQTAPVVGGATYELSGWVNAPPTTDRFRIDIKLMWRTDKGKISNQLIQRINKPTADWAPVTATLQAPPNATNARVMMVLGNLAADVYVDDFSLAATP